MKKLKILAVAIVTILSVNAAKAQVGVHLGFNVGAPYHRVYAPAPPPPVYRGYYGPRYYAPRVVYSPRYYGSPRRFYHPHRYYGYHRPYRGW